MTNQNSPAKGRIFIAKPKSDFDYRRLREMGEVIPLLEENEYCNVFEPTKLLKRMMDKFDAMGFDPAVDKLAITPPIVQACIAVAAVSAMFETSKLMIFHTKDHEYLTCDFDHDPV